MKKIIFLCSLITVILMSCSPSSEPEGYNYRRQITVETNLSRLQIENVYLDSSTVYPYTFYDYWDSSSDFIEHFTIYPVKDTGFIKLNLYSGKGNFKPPVSFKDSLVIHTPIDTTIISYSFFKFIKWSF